MEDERDARSGVTPLTDRLLDEIRLGVASQFDEARLQQEAIIEESAIITSIIEQLRHSGLLAEIARLDLAL